jgi:serine protease Do
LRDVRVRSLGSGVIIRKNGYILTNSHVVASAVEIKIALQDRREFGARLVGTDPKTDLAVLKIEAADLPVLREADSSRLGVGDLAFAIGNPFGIGQTVTMGIISATERGNLDIEKYEDFIQTDAAINPGNSGGALINARGELIGISTSILPSAGGGNQGIGFAIPIKMARYVAEQILKTGKVTRGSIGAIAQDVTPGLAQAFRLDSVQGALISQVAVNGPAARAGIERGDVVTAMNGKTIRDLNDLRVSLALAVPGSTARLKVARNGKQQEIPVQIAILPETPAPAPQARQNQNPIEGVQVQDLNAQMVRELGLAPNTRGVIVANIPEGSMAELNDLHRGDVIQELNRTPVANMSDFRKALAASESRQLVLLVNRGGITTYVALGEP